MKPTSLNQLTIGIKGAGEMASAVAWRVFSSCFHKILMLEVDHPLAVRREVAFCEAVYEGRKTVEDVEALKVSDHAGIQDAWKNKKIAVMVDPQWRVFQKIRPDVVVDAILAKSNLGTHLAEASLVIGLGPGFTAGEDVHMVIETNRGHNLGQIITTGSAQPNTGIPGSIGGQGIKRVLRAPAEGVFKALRSIGDPVKFGEAIGSVGKMEIRAQLDGALRGLIRPGTRVTTGLKIGDIDPRAKRQFCYTISDKARAVSGSVLEAILRIYN